MKIKHLAAALLVCILSTTAFADDGVTAGSGTGDVAESVEAASPNGKKEKEMPPYIPPPHFARRKLQMPEFLLKDKREDWFITGFPAIGFDPDTGFNFGAALQIYNNGKKDSPFFRITPYREAIQILAVGTTSKAMQFEAAYDSLYVAESPWRIRTDVAFEYNPVESYFGIGSNSQQLTFPGTGQVFTSYDSYKNALKVQTGGQTNQNYDMYKYSRMGWRASAEYDLLGGWLRPIAGLQVAYVWVGDYSGKTVAGATQRQTHLSADCNSGRAKGCRGGRDIYVKLGVSFDTRNFEPNPTKGIMWELVSELSPKFLGSSFNYGRLSTDLRAVGQILHFKSQKLTLAGRFMYEWQFGEVPFYSMSTLSFTDQDKTGLGGFRSLRGYRLDRFIGPVLMMTNLELRWQFYEFTIWKQNIRLSIKPFIDAGRVFDNVRQTSFNNWKLGGGSGLQLVWNVATVISFDAAWSGEGDAFYMDVGTQF